MTAVLLLAAASADAQIREPEMQAYRFVSENGRGAGIWVNPAAMGYSGRATKLIGAITFDRPEDGSWGTAQYVIGLAGGPLGFGYRHDEFSDTTGFAQADAYTLAAGYSSQNQGIGVSRTWRTVGDNEGSWEIGASAHSSVFSSGVVWRDIGSPRVRGVTRRERLLAALTVRPSETETAFSVQGDYQLDGGRLRAVRLGGEIRMLEAASFFALAEWDGDGDFEAFRLGGVLRLGRTLFDGGVGLSSGGDAQTGTLGATFAGPQPQ